MKHFAYKKAQIVHQIWRIIPKVPQRRNINKIVVIVSINQYK